MTITSDLLSTVDFGELFLELCREYGVRVRQVERDTCLHRRFLMRFGKGKRQISKEQCIKIFLYFRSFLNKEHYSLLLKAINVRFNFQKDQTNSRPNVIKRRRHLVTRRVPRCLLAKRGYAGARK